MFKYFYILLSFCFVDIVMDLKLIVNIKDLQLSFQAKNIENEILRKEKQLKILENRVWKFFSIHGL